jgi:flagellar biosynthesis/type III secretory pathway protein FliH
MGSAVQTGAPGQVEVFEYPAGPEEPSSAWSGWTGTEEADDPVEPANAAAGEATASGARAEFDRNLAEETRRSFEAGRERGRQEGRQAECEAQAATLAAGDQQRVRQATEMIESFAQERDRYLQSIEHEVVELALAVAARILRREAQMDPLLLTGAVRVALGQLSGSTQVKLLVPADELDLWTESIALLPNLALKPIVLAGEGMRLGDCRIETSLGSVDLGIRAQLGEIARGFFDRAGGRRVESAAAADDAAERESRR